MLILMHDYYGLICPVCKLLTYGIIGFKSCRGSGFVQRLRIDSETPQMFESKPNISRFRINRVERSRCRHDPYILWVLIPCFSFKNDS